MKAKLWLFQIPVAALFTFAYWVNESGYRGELTSAWLRDRLYPKIQQISGLHTNLKFNLRGPEAPKHKIVIVEVDSDSIDKYGRWPWHRDLTGSLVQNIFDAGAKFVGLDIVFSEPDKRVSPKMAEFFEKGGMKEKVEEFETDHFLENIVAFNADNLVIGWASEGECQPLYKSKNECPVADPEALAAVPPDLKKFEVKNVRWARPFDVSKTPMLVAPRFIANIPMYNSVANHAGYFDTLVDLDGYIRKSALIKLAPDGSVHPSLAMQMALLAKNEELAVEFDETQRVKSLKYAKSGEAIPVSPLGVMEVNFRGPADTFQYVKATEIMNPEDGIRIQTANRQIASVSKKELLKDALVFIGVTAVGVFDMRAFPFDSNTAGVEGHAYILDNLLSNDMLTHGNEATGTFWLYIAMIAGALFFAYGVEKLESVPALLLFISAMGGGYLVDQKWLFARNENWNTSLLILELSTIFVLTFAAKYVLEEKNKKFIRGAFAKYVSPAIIDSIMKDPAKLTVGGEKKELTILFSDIRSFTTFSEKMDAKQLATFLNEYLGKMTDIVFDTGGTLDKYIGDAVMAFWGAPLDQPAHSANAVRAAIQMQRLLAKDRPYFREKYGVEVNIGIGINTGTVNVGNMGSERIFEYTVIGDHVNLTSRLEGLTKDYHSGILTTRFTLDDIAKAGQPVPAHRVLDSVKVKGKKVAVELIQILERDLPADGLALFQEARKLYAAQQWDDAISKFNAAAEALKLDDKPDGMSLEYAERCREFKLNPPPADWDGAWVMTTK